MVLVKKRSRLAIAPCSSSIKADPLVGLGGKTTETKRRLEVLAIVGPQSSSALETRVQSIKEGGSRLAHAVLVPGITLGALSGVLDHGSASLVALVGGLIGRSRKGRHGGSQEGNGSKERELHGGEMGGGRVLGRSIVWKLGGLYTCQLP